jgi:glutamyl-Q tRNA(Asp) synthetase
MVIGRFAPSPTGPLHFGSLVAALASYLNAKQQSGLWILRMEDLDKPREIPGARDEILSTLDRFGLHWDGNVLYQSTRFDIYEHYLSQLREKGLLYHCRCTRKEISDSSPVGIEGPIYSGKCRHLHINTPPFSVRILVNHQPISFVDLIQGPQIQNLNQDIGDFIIKRADAQFAYQLAVVVDDALQNVTEVVRGADLLDSTPRQLYLQEALGFKHPSYAHIPVATNQQQEKLSKQTLAKPISGFPPQALILKALSFLGQSPPHALQNAPLSEILSWAIIHWQLHQVPKCRHIAVDNQDSLAS